MTTTDEPVLGLGDLERPAWLPVEAEVTEIVLVPPCLRDDPGERHNWSVSVKWTCRGWKINDWRDGNGFTPEPYFPTLEAALARAAEILPLVRVMGKSAQEFVDWRAWRVAETERTRTEVVRALTAARVRVSAESVVAPDLVWVNARARDRATRALAKAGWVVTGTWGNLVTESRVGLYVKRTAGEA